ncbi:MAG: hypothetical protein WCS54_05575 [Fibrobacteraceae bacterium]
MCGVLSGLDGIKAGRKAGNFPYLPKGTKIDHANQVWSMGITPASGTKTASPI